MSDWVETTLGNHIHVKHGYAFKGKDISKEPTNDILVTPGNFYIGGGFKSNKFKYFNSDYPKSYALKKNDVVVTMTDLSKEGDTLGYAAKIPEIKNKTFLHNQRIGLVEFLSNDVDSDFIYWMMRTRDYQGFILGAASGTSIRHTSPTSIKSYDFQLPPLPEQKAIASVLSSLDDKIDLLHRQNKTLESTAETLFRQWFIEEASDDWETEEIGGLVSISSGKGLKRTEYNDNGIYPVLGANGEIGRTDKYLYDETLIYTGRVGTLGNIFINDSKAWFSDNTLIIKPNDKEYFYFIYFTLIDAKLGNYNVGSTQPLIRQSDIKKLPVSIPNKKLIYKFKMQAEELFLKIKHNQKQIKTLESLRDTLLPKLMSGAVRVAFESNQQAEAV